MRRQILLKGAEEKRAEFQLQVIITLWLVIDFGVHTELARFRQCGQTRVYITVSLAITGSVRLGSAIEGTVLGHGFGEKLRKERERGREAKRTLIGLGGKRLNVMKRNGRINRLKIED